jgi:DNA polymerase III sliding clamp (beta) subunit (PCNA family)
MPMLANVLLRTQVENQLLVAATDLNLSLAAELTSLALTFGSFRVASQVVHLAVALLLRVVPESAPQWS